MINPTHGPEPIRLAVGATPIIPLLRRAKLPNRTNDLIPAIREISARLSSGWPIGLELDLLRRGFGALEVSVPEVKSPLVRDVRYLSHTADQVRKLQRRPPSELAAKILWERAVAGPLTEADLLAAAETAGGAAGLRTGRMMTTPFPSGHYREFVAPDQVRARFDRLLRRLNETEPKLHPLLHAIAIYYETLLIHPLRDGNGRLARLLFQVSLRQTIGLRAPILPLGPASVHSRPALMGAYLAWEFDRNAQPLVDFVFAAVAQLVDLYVRTSKPK